MSSDHTTMLIEVDTNYEVLNKNFFDYEVLNKELVNDEALNDEENNDEILDEEFFDYEIPNEELFDDEVSNNEKYDKIADKALNTEQMSSINGKFIPYFENVIEALMFC